MKITEICIVSGLLFLLTACGGGGGDSSSTPPTPSPPPIDPTLAKPQSLSDNAIFSVYADTQAQSGESIGLAIVANANIVLNSVKWTQLSGPTVTILATQSQAAGFDVDLAGNYQFQVTATATTGQSATELVDVSVQQNSATKANIRVDHTVSEQANVSLRMDPSTLETPSAWQWKQIAGSVSVVLEAQDSFVFFDAPSVIKDEIVVIEGSMTLNNGEVLTDTSMIVIKNVEINSDGFFPRFSERIVTTDMFAYNENSPYKEALARCVYDNQVGSSCLFSVLPLIGSEFSQPAIDNILDRVFVSHQWMGDRFKQFLENSATSEDMLKLLRATTAIVISYDVRPSFYWTASGAIYLDAANFWMTPGERDTLNARPDFRSNFGNDLQFIIPWRYIKDNDLYFRNADYPRSERKTKVFADMEANVAWLMYHELGHANDFFPPSSWSSLASSTSPLVYSNDTDANSTGFANAFPLTSSQMQSLAQVSFAGNTATNTQKAYTASRVSDFFIPDSAPAYYSYSTIREDYATLFERFMMAYRLGVTADVAMVEIDDDGLLPVAWGQRNRINDPKLRTRAEFVIKQILPDINLASAFDGFAAPQLFQPGVGYREQLNLDGNKTLKKPDALEIPNQYFIADDLIHPHAGRPEIPRN